MRVFIFGDSIAHGFYDSKGGWVQRLTSDLHMQTLASMKSSQDFYAEVHNLGISGDTADGVIDRIEGEVEARRLHDTSDLIVISIGINDSLLRDNMAICDVYDFQEKIEKLADKAKDISGKVVFVGLSPVDESLTDPWKFGSNGEQWKNNRINLFEDTIKQVAITRDIPFIPIHDAFLESMNKGHNLLSDGLHPNDAGHEMIYQIVKPVIGSIVSEG